MAKEKQIQIPESLWKEIVDMAIFINLGEAVPTSTIDAIIKLDTIKKEKAFQREAYTHARTCSEEEKDEAWNYYKTLRNTPN